MCRWRRVRGPRRAANAVCSPPCASRRMRSALARLTRSSASRPGAPAWRPLDTATRVRGLPGNATLRYGPARSSLRRRPRSRPYRTIRGGVLGTWRARRGCALARKAPCADSAGGERIKPEELTRSRKHRTRKFSHWRDGLGHGPVPALPPESGNPFVTPVSDVEADRRGVRRGGRNARRGSASHPLGRRVRRVTRDRRTRSRSVQSAECA